MALIYFNMLYGIPDSYKKVDPRVIWSAELESAASFIIWDNVLWVSKVLEQS